MGAASNERRYQECLPAWTAAELGGIWSFER